MNLRGLNLNFSFRFSSCKGFTIIELIVVMSIIGILAVLTVPRLIDVGSISAKESGEMVAADIRKTQELAMADTVSHQIQFTNGSSSYVIDPGTAKPQTITLSQGVTINTTRTITFTTSGDPGSSDITINVGGVSVVVTRETGKVTVSGSPSPGC